jgi:hypothetical protein
MKASEAFPSKYLKASDLEGKNRLAIMDYVQIEKLGDDERPVLYFQGQEKGLVLNRTNTEAIATLYGDEMNDWQGQEIVMFKAMVAFKKETVPAIRVRAPTRRVQPRQAATNGHAQRRPEMAEATEKEWTDTAPRQSAQMLPRNDMDDEIPF